MPTKYPVETVLNDCDRITRVWVENPTFTLGEVTLKTLQDKIESTRDKQERLEGLKMQVTGLTSELNDDVAELNSIRTRALSGLRATFGPNSKQYEQGGGTPADERKRAARKNGGPKDGESKS